MSTVPNLDLEKYLGNWHQIANISSWFDTGCDFAKATYSLNPDQTIRVFNECLDQNYQKVRDIVGSAKIVNPLEPGKLEVLFNGQPETNVANYYIHYTDYINISIVGSPDKNSLWILARQPQISFQLLQQLSIFIKDLGYDLEKINYNTQSIN